MYLLYAQILPVHPMNKKKSCAAKQFIRRQIVTNDKAGAAHPRLGPTSSRVTSWDVAVRDVYARLYVLHYTHIKPA